MSGPVKILLQLPTIIQSCSLFTILTSVITVGLTILLQKMKENKQEKKIPLDSFKLKEEDKAVILGTKETRYKKVPNFDNVECHNRVL